MERILRKRTGKEKSPAAPTAGPSGLKRKTTIVRASVSVPNCDETQYPFDATHRIALPIDTRGPEHAMGYHRQPYIYTVNKMRTFSGKSWASLPIMDASLVPKDAIWVDEHIRRSRDLAQKMTARNLPLAFHCPFCSLGMTKESACYRHFRGEGKRPKTCKSLPPADDPDVLQPEDAAPIMCRGPALCLICNPIEPRPLAPEVQKGVQDNLMRILEDRRQEEEDDEPTDDDDGPPAPKRIKQQRANRRSRYKNSSSKKN